MDGWDVGRRRFGWESNQGVEHVAESGAYYPFQVPQRPAFLVARLLKVALCLHRLSTSSLLDLAFQGSVPLLDLQSAQECSLSPILRRGAHRDQLTRALGTRAVLRQLFHLQAAPLI